MGKAKWLVVALCGLAAGNAFADNRTEMQITPYAGYSHLRIDGPFLEGGETERMDQAMGGVTFGFLTPIGVVLEAGTNFAFHEDIFDEDNDFGLDQDYAAIGYQFDFAEGWRFVPKIGRMKWKLTSDDRDLVDALGEPREQLRGYDNFYEASLMRHVSKSIALGLNFRDVDTQYGHSRSGTFVVTFGF